MTKLNRTLASVAQQTHNRDESKWLFDFDVDDEKLARDFRDDLYIYTDTDYPIEEVEFHKTPNGYGVVVPRGFDTRKLMEKWQDYDITLKKDELLFLKMITTKDSGGGL